MHLCKMHAWGEGMDMCMGTKNGLWHTLGPPQQCTCPALSLTTPIREPANARATSAFPDIFIPGKGGVYMTIRPNSSEPHKRVSLGGVFLGGCS